MTLGITGYVFTGLVPQGILAEAWLRIFDCAIPWNPYLDPIKPSSGVKVWPLARPPKVGKIMAENL